LYALTVPFGLLLEHAQLQARIRAESDATQLGHDPVEHRIEPRVRRRAVVAVGEGHRLHRAVGVERVEERLDEPRRAGLAHHDRGTAVVDLLGLDLARRGHHAADLLDRRRGTGRGQRQDADDARGRTDRRDLERAPPHGSLLA
jgi:hypothetical protein